MILKWICCTVTKDKRSAFSRAQEAWSKIAAIRGFMAQAGGWDSHNLQRATVLGLWEDRSFYKAFMSKHHDRIHGGSRQDQTYTKCEVRIFDTLFEIPGSKEDFVEALQAASILRVARYRQRPEREKPFCETQAVHWAPGMKHVGMLGGLFSKGGEEKTEYLVTTAWRDQKSHKRYRKELFPSLRAASGVDGDIIHLEGALLALEKAWWVGRQ